MADAEPAPTPVSGNAPNSVNLRVIALAHSTNENEDVYLVMDLDTTISQLKEQLQQNLSQHPRPETQRLIYQGRPLTDGNAPLRQILRLEPVTANASPSHVLHLVVRDDQSTTPSRTNRPPAANSHNTPQSNTATPQLHNNPIPTAFGLAQQAFPHGHPAQAIIQNAMQQHMAIHNQHHQNAHPSPFPLPTFNIPQGPAGQNGSLPPSNANIQQPANSHSPPITDSNVPTGDNPTTSPASNISQNGVTMTVEETVGPNGERIRRIVHNGQPLPIPSVPVERSASAPGSRPARPLTPARSALPHQPLPVMLPRVPMPQLANFQQQLGRLPTMPIGNLGLGSIPPAQQTRDPLVYLISSATGPEALLFTPSHGYFTSQQTSTTTQPMAPTQSNNIEAQPLPVQPTPTQPVQQNATPRNSQPNQIALRPQVPARGQAVQQPGRREGEEILAQVFQRGWLFIRLYMFIFVLSEPGTWRRYILLLLASLVCLLPRNNPFTDLFLAARRHFDNLIGPPQPPARPARQQGNDQQAQRNDATTLAPDQGPGGSETIPRHRSTDSRMPTPEEHARRLLREHEQRNPNTVRDVLYRIEQAVALFLASLIPGVGERHVRAREEARRVVQEEEERRRREEEERQRAQTEQEVSKPDEVTTTPPDRAPAQSSASAATSTGVETTSANDGLRMRGADATDRGS